MVMATKKNSQAWEGAKTRCRLNETDIQMTKELRMTPKSLIKNIPVPNQKRKATVKVWIRNLYGEMFGRGLTVNPALSKALRKSMKQEDAIVSKRWVDEEDLPF